MRSLSELLDLSGRVALITGGCGHIGSAAAHALAQAKASVAVADMDQDQADALASELRTRYGVPAAGFGIDLAVHEDVVALPARVADALGGLGILINNAAFVGTSGLTGWVTPFEQQSTETWRAALEVNLTACFTLCREATPLLRASGHGSIINVGSIYAVIGPNMGIYEGTAMGNPVAYAASKGGLLQMTRWLATTLGPDIRVNALSPGGVWRNQPDVFVKRYVERTPLQRMATEEDMIGTIIYLAGDLSAYVTGQNILVDGGFSVW